LDLLSMMLYQMELGEISLNKQMVKTLITPALEVAALACGQHQKVYGNHKNRNGERTYFPSDSLANVPAKSWVFFNTAYRDLYKTDISAAVVPGAKKAEVLDQFVEVSPFTREGFGEKNCEILVEDWYRAELGGGEVHFSQQSYAVREKSMLNDYLIASKDHDVLDFLNWRKKEQYTAFVMQWVKERRDTTEKRLKEGYETRMLSDVIFHLRRAYSTINTFRVLNILEDMVETGRMYIGQVNHKSTGVEVHSALTKKRKYWQFVKADEIMGLKEKGWAHEIDELEFLEDKVGYFVAQKIQAAFRHFDLETAISTPSREHPLLSAVSPYLTIAAVNSFYEQLREIRAGNVELTLGQGKQAETVQEELPKAESEFDLVMPEAEMPAVEQEAELFAVA